MLEFGTQYLDYVGVIRPKFAARAAGVVTLPFNGPARDRPDSATLNLDVGRTRALPIATAKSLSQQSLTGSANLRVRIAQSSSSDPCADGVDVGTFQLLIADGAVTAVNASLPLPPRAVTFAISGSFTICLEVTATIDVRLEVPQMSIAFGPDTGLRDAGDDEDVNTPSDGGNNGDTDSGGPQSDPNTPDVPNMTNEPNTPGSTGDGMTDNPPDKFTVAAPLHVGSEAIIAGPAAIANTGFVTPENFTIGRIAMSGGGGVNLFTTFAPMEGLTDVYERSIPLGGKKAFLNANYSVHIIAVDATGTRTSFRDIAVTP